MAQTHTKDTAASVSTPSPGPTARNYNQPQIQCRGVTSPSSRENKRLLKRCGASCLLAAAAKSFEILLPEHNSHPPSQSRQLPGCLETAFFYRCPVWVVPAHGSPRPFHLAVRDICAHYIPGRAQPVTGIKHRRSGQAAAISCLPAAHGTGPLLPLPSS